MCDTMAQTFNDGTGTDTYNFANVGGLKSMGRALDRGMVLVMSIWDDAGSRMLWLDAEKPRIDKDPAFPGVSRGPCAFESGVAESLHETSAGSSVTFTDVKFGPIGSTFQDSQEPAPAAKFAIDDAATPLSHGVPLAVSVAGISAGFVAAVALAVAVRGHQVRN